MRSPQALTARFRASGRKVTPQRERIFRALQDDQSHPSAEAVFEAVRADMPTISLRTVYATLAELAELGEVSQIDLGTGAARFDTHVGPHHHLVCSGCGAVFDFEADFAEVAVPADHLGFTVESTEIVFRGRCANCAG